MKFRTLPTLAHLGLLGVARAREPALLAERRQDAEARPAWSDRKAGCLKGASGEMARATPSRGIHEFAGRLGLGVSRAGR
jgi:hypothetical protein